MESNPADPPHSGYSELNSVNQGNWTRTLIPNLEPDGKNPSPNAWSHYGIGNDLQQRRP